MVLWELTLATAYVLGLKRTYRLALRIQRRVISARHPRLREFVYRRSRNVFDIALCVHRKVQERDIEVGRSIGNWILRWLDRIKPSANIRGEPSLKLPTNNTRSISKSAGVTTSKGVSSSDGQRLSADKEAGRNLFIMSMPESRTGTGHFASILKNKDKGGFQLNSRFGIKSLPQMAHGLFWQPVRRNVTALGSSANEPFSTSLTSQLHSKGISRGIIREDIAVWMHR